MLGISKETMVEKMAFYFYSKIRLQIAYYESSLFRKKKDF